ncbi:MULTISPECIES: VOC family protein [unclassified Salinibacterium]|uniref:VOC family protein n=1 Tax=unclassified Salinibacterium TaxID=2632331 RepID=UPI00143CD149|nr:MULTISPECIES: VOC family protein [unclassified Salinibacterium]
MAAHAFEMKAIVNHFEIPADDLERAQSFYAEVFGWKMENWGDGNIMVEAAEGGIGGDIHQRGSDVPHPTFVITVDRIEDAVAAITAKGGQMVSAILTMQGMGRYAYFKDSEGNLLGVWDTVTDAVQEE